MNYSNIVSLRFSCNSIQKLNISEMPRLVAFSFNIPNIVNLIVPKQLKILDNRTICKMLNDKFILKQQLTSTNVLTVAFLPNLNAEHAFRVN